MTGIDTLNNVDSTGNLIVTNLSQVAALGFSGSTTNNSNVTYTADALKGTSDKQVINLNNATAVTATVNAGFEAAEINSTGTNTLTALTVPGVTSLTLSGSGDLKMAATGILNAFTTMNVTGTGNYTLDDITGIATLSAAAAASVKAVNIDATTGFATDTIAAGASGLTLITGAGADNLKVTGTTGATKSSTVKLGAGNDILDYTNSNGASYIFGEDGDDLVQISGAVALDTADVVDLGTGTDTLQINNTANTLVLRGVENITLTTNATGTQDVNSADSALAVTAKVNNTAFDIQNLTAGSTVKVVDDSATNNGGAAGTNVTFKAAEATSTVTFDAKKVTGNLTTNNIADVTLAFNETVAMGSDDIDVKNATALTITAAKAFAMDDILAGNDKLTSLSVTGSDAVEIDDIVNDNKLATVSVTGAKNVSVGAIADATSITDVTVTSTTGTADIDAIGATTKTTNAVNVTVSAAKTATVGAINGIGASKVGNVTVSGTEGLVTVGKIDATDLGTIDITASKGAIKAGAINAADATGITVNMSATTFISDDGATPGGSDIIVKNTKGNISATLAGAAKAAVDYTINDSAATGVGSVTLNASSLTGGLDTTITNDEAKGEGSSSITLGAKDANTVNTVDLDGYSAMVTVTGSAGKDTVKDLADGTLADGTTKVVNSSDTFVGNAGIDTLDYSSHAFTVTGTLAANEATTNGLAMNFSSSTITFYAGTNTTTEVNANGTTTLASGKVAQYDAGATGASADEQAIIAGGEMDTVSGFEVVVGTANNDYIAVANTGMTVTGGKGADIIIANAGVDTIKMSATGETYSVAKAADIVSGTTALTGIDKVYGIASGDKIDLSAILNTFTGAAATDAIASASGTKVALIQGKLAADGVWTTGTTAGTHTDTLFVYDADGAGAGTVLEAIALVGVVATGTADAGVLTLA